MSVFLDERLTSQLARLEEIYATDPGFMERATHLLLVGCHEATSSDEFLMASTSRTASVWQSASAALSRG